MKNHIKPIIGVLFIAIISYIFFDKTIATFFASNSCYVKDFISYFSKFGISKYYLIGSFLIFILCYRSFKTLSKAALYIFVTTATSGIIIIIIKIVFARYRPPKFINEELYGFNWFDIGYIVNSFPSGHSATAFSVFVALALLLPKYRWFFLLFASLIAFSRVTIGVHYFSDILVGSLIGTLTSLYFYKKFYPQPQKLK